MVLAQPRSSCWSHSVTVAQRLSVIAAAKKQKPQKPQKKKLRKPKGPVSERIFLDFDEYEVDDDEPDMVLLPGTKVPKAPSTADQAVGKAPRPEDLYPVFPKPQQQSVTPISNEGKWSWGEDRPTGQAAQQDVPMWNPKTGFMRTREEVEQQQQQQAAAAAASSSEASSSEAGIRGATATTSTSSSNSSSGNPSSSWGSNAASSSSKSSTSSGRLVEPLPPAAAQQHLPSAGASPPPAAAAPAADATGDLPAVSREQVLGSCFTTSAGMAVLAVLLHIFAQQQAAGLLRTDQATIDQLLRIPAGLESAQNAGYMLAAAGVVTAARLVLMQQWQEFGAATNRSNKQVLSPLGWPDVLAVAVLTGISEEFLFRGGLIPASLPDYRGVLLAGVVFGLLHNSGGRNLAFAAWATVVGWLYGGAYLATGNIWVAAGAHAVANFASAAVWISKNKTSEAAKQ